ncbi:MAG TPA: acyl-CoA dehydrogenase family protein [Stellaceae bacterium]|jgi:alkylation response protein AidB-like acyl-CoA dehydrogenase
MPEGDWRSRAVTGDDWVARARALAPLTEKYRDEGEAKRQLPQKLFEGMRDAGLFHLWVPRAYGGAEVDLATKVRVTEEVSRQDGAAGWNVMIGGNTAILWGFMNEAVARGIFADDPNSVIAGTILATHGRAKKVPGGYRINGKWPLASGCHHANWMVTACFIFDDDGKPKIGPDGQPEPHAFFVPIADCEILDTWYSAGLRGTGSTHFQCTDIFVPDDREFASIGAPPVQKGPLYSTQIPNIWGPNVAAVALGIARDAIESFIRLATEKKPSRMNSLLAQQDVVQNKVGEAEGLLRSGRAFMMETIDAMWQRLSAGKPVPMELAAENRLACSTAVQQAIKATDLMFGAAGATSIYATSRLERCFRDVHMVSQHGVVGPTNIMFAGRSMLGLTPEGAFPPGR